MAPVLTNKSPTFITGFKAAVLPMRIKTSAPILLNSCVAMDADGQPRPVEVTETFTPL